MTITSDTWAIVINVPFQLDHCDNQWFEWFAKTFLDLSNRLAHAYYFKAAFNDMPVMKFSDEKEE